MANQRVFGFYSPGDRPGVCVGEGHDRQGQRLTIRGSEAQDLEDRQPVTFVIEGNHTARDVRAVHGAEESEQMSGLGD